MHYITCLSCKSKWEASFLTQMMHFRRPLTVSLFFVCFCVCLIKPAVTSFIWSSSDQLCAALWSFHAKQFGAAKLSAACFNGKGSRIVRTQFSVTPFVQVLIFTPKSRRRDLPTLACVQTRRKADQTWRKFHETWALDQLRAAFSFDNATKRVEISLLLFSLCLHVFLFLSFHQDFFPDQRRCDWWRWMRWLGVSGPSKRSFQAV